jgi:DNA mismatch repair protein MutL
LLIPITLRLTQRERQKLEENIIVFEKLGFQIEADTLTAVPFMFKGPLPAGFFTDVLDALDNEDEPGYKKNTAAMTACKAAVKANDTLTEAEARELITEMLALDNPFTCPHGRPTVIEITKKEIERKFKRT